MPHDYGRSEKSKSHHEVRARPQGDGEERRVSPIMKHGQGHKVMGEERRVSPIMKYGQGHKVMVKSPAYQFMQVKREE